MLMVARQFEFSSVFIVRAENELFKNYNQSVQIISQDTTTAPTQGERTVMPVFYTLVWRRTPDGWRIIHEHGSNLITEDSPVGQTSR